MHRIPEPDELMDEAAQALAYARADFSDANRLFVERLEALAGPHLAGRLLDLGCGPADIPRALARRHPRLEIDAVDGARAMLDLAAAGMGADVHARGRIRLLHEHLPSSRLAADAYSLVVSNSLLHHLRDPAVMWQTVARCGRPGALVLVMDLARPGSTAAVDALVAAYAADAPAVLRRDFRNSLFAAYTTGEVADQLAAAGLHGLEVATASNRHLTVAGRLPG